jgi:hypothetical protein
MVKKKRKTRKKNYQKFDIREGETHIDSLRRRAREQGFTTGDEGFPIKTVFWILIIVGLLLGAYYSEPTSVNECAKGFSGLIPCHCYTESLPARCI